MRALRSMQAGRGDVVRGELCSIRRGQTGTRCIGWCTSLTYSGRKSTRILSVTVSATEQPTSPVVTISIPYRVQFGEVLRVVGTGSQLGDWSADQALQLAWTEGDVWTAEVPFNAGHYEFKCVVYNTETKSVTRWEDGGNRILNITEEPGTWDVNCQWGATADMTQAFTPAPASSVPEAVATVTESPSAAVEPSGPTAPAPELVPSFMALEGAVEEAKLEPQVPLGAGIAVEAPPAASEAAASVAGSAEAVPAAASGGAGGAAVLLLATCAAGAVAAFALLTPGGLEKSALGGGSTQVVSTTTLKSSAAGAQVKSQVQSQLAALADQVSAVQPVVQAQISNVTGTVADGLSSLQPMMRSGVAYMHSQATALQSKAATAVAEASSSDPRQG